MGLCFTTIAQTVYQPYSFQYDQNFNHFLYSVSTKEHTSLKPLLADDSLIRSYTENYSTNQNILLNDKLSDEGFFSDHQLAYYNNNSTFYMDVLPDISVGRSFNQQKNVSNTSLGIQLGGTISKKFSYQIMASENNGLFPDYISRYINQTGIIPGQATANNNGTNSYQWTYLTALASYSPKKFLNISIGRDKNFIGDGYRSLLLSDYSSPYIFCKLTATLGSVKYMAMWTYMNDPATTNPYNLYYHQDLYNQTINNSNLTFNKRHKFGVFHFLDWTASKRLSIGLFENVIGYYTDDNGSKRPFDFYYANPLIVLKPINNSSANPDKSLLGVTGKFKLSSKFTAYWQFALNEFSSKDLFPNNGSYVNKYAYQFGFRGYEPFKIKGLSYLFETNSVRPYTYAARSAIENYSNNGEPLAHPWGGNFREALAQLNYIKNRWSVSLEADFGKYGLDSNATNYGKNIFKIYTIHSKDYDNTIGQGVATTMVYLETKISYLLNPNYNLRLELGGIFRNEKNDLFNDKTSIITFGIRTSFRNTYNDLTSIKTH